MRGSSPGPGQGELVAFDGQHDRGERPRQAGRRLDGPSKGQVARHAPPEAVRVDEPAREVHALRRLQVAGADHVVGRRVQAAEVGPPEQGPVEGLGRDPPPLAGQPSEEDEGHRPHGQRTHPLEGEAEDGGHHQHRHHERQVGVGERRLPQGAAGDGGGQGGDVGAEVARPGQEEVGLEPHPAVGDGPTRHGRDARDLGPLARRRPGRPGPPGRTGWPGVHPPKGKRRCAGWTWSDLRSKVAQQ